MFPSPYYLSAGFFTHSKKYRSSPSPTLQMPVMDGFESVTRYRAFEQTLLPRTKRLFIMGMSANNDAQSRAEALATGMDVFVAKPFTYGNLVNILIGTKLGEAVVVKNDESMTTTSS